MAITSLYRIFMTLLHLMSLETIVNIRHGNPERKYPPMSMLREADYSWLVRRLKAQSCFYCTSVLSRVKLLERSSTSGTDSCT